MSSLTKWGFWSCWSLQQEELISWIRCENHTGYTELLKWYFLTIMISRFTDIKACIVSGNMTSYRLIPCIWYRIHMSGSLLFWNFSLWLFTIFKGEDAVVCGNGKTLSRIQWLDCSSKGVPKLLQIMAGLLGEICTVSLKQI